MIALLVAEIVLTLFVIAGGAVVRATGSGAGCGEHWPLCNGEALPINPKIETIIEFTHRLTSGSSLLVFVILYFLLRRRLAKGHPTLAWANLALASFFLEAGIGALLVLKKLVAGDTSYLRAFVIALHLVNTYILLAALVGALWTIAGLSTVRPQAVATRWRWLLGGWCLVGAIGAIVALGDTLFPAHTLLNGLQQELSATSHPLIRLRAVHPLLALTVALGTVIVAFGRRYEGRAARAANVLSGLVLLQVAGGVLNWVLLAPLWLQITHLALADLCWLAVVTFSLATTV